MDEPGITKVIKVVSGVSHTVQFVQGGRRNRWRWKLVSGESKTLALSPVKGFLTEEDAKAHYAVVESAILSLSGAVEDPEPEPARQGGLRGFFRHFLRRS